jgi:prepilin-type N-terminal cleavage/methylation domain-containing protein
MRSRRSSGFTLLEAMVVLAIFGIVTTTATMTFVAMLQTAKRGRGALQAMTGTRAVMDFLMEEGRAAGGTDLVPNARVLIDKGGGEKGTDVVWLLKQNVGYSVCAITGRSGDTLTFATVVHNGRLRCCFEAQDAIAGTPDVVGEVPTGAAFRRTAVVSDVQQRFLPVFLSGTPNAAACQLTMHALPGIDRVINDGRGNAPNLIAGIAVLTDVKRFYVDFNAEGVRPPFGALYSQVELDGEVTSFANERQRLSSNTLDFRASVGYGSRRPDVPEDPDDEDAIAAFADDGTDDGTIPDVPAGGNPFIERATDRGGWLNAPVPVQAGTEAPPSMLGLAIQTGVASESPPPSLPWTTVPLTPAANAQVMSLTGRVMFRSEGAP